MSAGYRILSCAAGGTREHAGDFTCCMYACRKTRANVRVWKILKERSQNLVSEFQARVCAIKVLPCAACGIREHTWDINCCMGLHKVESKTSGLSEEAQRKPVMCARTWKRYGDI